MKVKKGQTVLIRQRSNGNGKLGHATDSVQPIIGLYMTGNVKVACGDIWTVIPWGGPESDFIAIN